MDETLFDLERKIKELSKTPTEKEFNILWEKSQRIRMAIKEAENACHINFKDAKSSMAGIERLLSEIDTENGNKNVMNRINKINSEIFRELDNCIDRLRMER